MAITDWPEAERPRERLLAQGPAVLSDAELLAIFLRVGVAGESAVDLARRLLTAFGGLRGLLVASRQDFCREKGLGDAKYAQLQAVLEMARRHLAERLRSGEAMSRPEVVAAFLSAQLRDLRREVFGVLMLDTQHRVLAFERIAEGTLNAATVYPREVLRAALRHDAAAVILAHNHPSGVSEPSAADRHLTDRLVSALSLVDIRVLDHLIVGDGPPFSFAERGWL